MNGFGHASDSRSTVHAVPASGPFFQRGANGPRFWFFHAPANGEGRGCVLAVHAFAEEMNKTRAAAADGARALAAAGFAVLQIDLLGCGDSSGDFEDANWDAWMQDLADGWAWLQSNAAGPRWIWGTRLGALLADQFASRCVPAADGLVFWQPVVSGTQHLGQFLRLKTVNNLLRAAPADESAASRVAQPSPRAELAAGHAIEVAGYRLTPRLADAIEGARLGASSAPDGRIVPRVRWLEVASQPDATLNPVATKVVERWRGLGSDVAVTHVVGSAFWQTLEIERCDALVDATVEALAA